MLGKKQCRRQFMAVAAAGLLSAAVETTSVDRFFEAAAETTGISLFEAAKMGNMAYAEEDKLGEKPDESNVIPVASYFDDMATDSTDPLGIIWVLAIDVSASVVTNRGEYAAQLSAFADAIERDDFREAIFGLGGPGSAGIFVVDFDNKSKLQIGGVDFRENDPARFREFADKLRNLSRRDKGSTAHYAALENAAICFDLANQRGWTSDRKHVNVMTDGSSTRKHNYYYRRLLALRHEATVSALVVKPSNGFDVYERVQEDLTTPPHTFLRRDRKSYVEGGFTEEVATELETQGGNISRYQDKTFMIMRHQITLHTAQLDLDDNRETFFAMAEPVSRRTLMKAPEPK